MLVRHDAHADTRPGAIANDVRGLLAARSLEGIDGECGLPPYRFPWVDPLPEQLHTRKNTRLAPKLCLVRRQAFELLAIFSAERSHVIVDAGNGDASSGIRERCQHADERHRRVWNRTAPHTAVQRTLEGANLDLDCDDAAQQCRQRRY